MKQATTTKPSPTSDIQPIPQSWDLKSWETHAKHVWPHDSERARRVLRSHRFELQSYGALCRIGRNIVFLGLGYSKWLVANMHRVADIDIPMNRPENAAKRFGGKQR